MSQNRSITIENYLLEMGYVEIKELDKTYYKDENCIEYYNESNECHLVFNTKDELANMFYVSEYYDNEGNPIKVQEMKEITANDALVIFFKFKQLDML
jgi:hypothetical protein